MHSLAKTSFSKYLQSLDALHAEPEYGFEFDRCLREHPVLRKILENSNSLSFVLDYRTGKYYYFSANAAQIVGHKREAFISEGMFLTMEIHLKEDAQIYYNNIFEKRLKFIKKLKAEDFSAYSFQHNYRILLPDKTNASLLQEYRVIRRDEKGNPLVILGYCSNISAIKTDTRITDAIILRKPGELPKITDVSHYYPRPEESLLSAKELEILKWILEGMNSKEIADKMHLSAHTIRTHRKHMHEKTNARNMADLLRYALTNGLI